MTTATSVRLDSDLLANIKSRAASKNMSVNAYITAVLAADIEDEQDLYIAEQAHQEWEQQGKPTTKWADFKKARGL